MTKLDERPLRVTHGIQAMLDRASVYACQRGHRAAVRGRVWLERDRVAGHRNGRVEMTERGRMRPRALHHRLGYSLLCGRHAYPVQRLDQLRDCWQSSPIPPSSLAVECPPALEDLLLSLLNLDPDVRPAHAAEVIDRLGELADLPPLPRALAVRGYFNRPTLVGRAREMHVLRSRLGMLSSHASGLCIVGTTGAGRTRLLEELVLEAKLAGAIVVQASGRRGATSFDVIRELCAQLLVAAPEVTLKAAEPHLSMLCQVLPALRVHHGHFAVADAPPRTQRETAKRWAQAQPALIAWLSTLSEHSPLVIALDDLHACDDASAGVLAGLSRASGSKRLLVAVTLLKSERLPITSARATFREHAGQLLMAPLTLDATTELYRHVFGAVPHLYELAMACVLTSHASRLARR